ncbi:MAG: YiiX/YebB-like N1pC/P60 family cysteine hydrolase [Ignavibacteriaceae bacterium]|nr:YiiX/YebB-like N1pC/P60 family cysteine hydrolase [Ignavibacteriaceae bacterium]
MKKILLIISIVVLILLLFLGTYLKKRYYNPWVRLKDSKKQVKLLIDNNQLKDGDIIFQTSLSRQSKAIQLVTYSKYSHCGIIYKINDDYMVFEAVQPIRYTPLAKWIARGDDNHFVIKRLNNADSILTPDNVKKMLKAGESFKGKDYDIYFERSDKNIYCSELIWKVYKRTLGFEIEKL